VSVQPVSVIDDAAIGRAIRELWQEGVTITVLPRGDDNKIVLAVMDLRPDEDQYTEVDELVVNTPGSYAQSKGA
jgi:hypothetical protein